MDGVDAGDGRGREDRRDVEVAVARRRRADADRLVGQPHMHGVAVGRRMDRHRLDAHLAAGAMDAERDLAAVGDQDLVEHRADASYSTIISGSPNSTGWRVVDQDLRHRAGLGRLDRIEGLHRLDDQQRLARPSPCRRPRRSWACRARARDRRCRPSATSPRRDAWPTIVGRGGRCSGAGRRGGRQLPSRRARPPPSRSAGRPGCAARRRPARSRRDGSRARIFASLRTNSVSISNFAMEKRSAMRCQRASRRDRACSARR